MLNYKEIPISEIKVNPNNPRINDEASDKLAKGIETYGFINPIIVNHQNELLAGHTRIKAMQKLGKTTIPAIFVDMDEADAKGFSIYDNKSAEFAEWDSDLLKIEIEALQEMNFDIDLLGFSLEELEDLDINLDGNIDMPLDESKADDVPELVENPVIKLGDLIELGHNYQHRLLCGSSTESENIEKVMDGKKAIMVFTDPPYLIQTKGGEKGAIGASLRKQGKEIEFIADFNPMEFLKAVPSVFEKNYFNAYIFCNKDLLPDYLMWAKENKISFNPLIWKKPSAIPIGGSHRPDVEFLLLFRKSAKWNGALKDVSYSRVIEESRETGLHPTMKPVPLIENQMLISSDKNDIVLDFFGGSGSTMIACENLDRNCRMIELSNQYAQVIIQRYVDYTSNPMIKINGKEVDWYEYKEKNSVA